MKYDGPEEFNESADSWTLRRYAFLPDCIELNTFDTDLDAAGARKLAAQLIKAADAIDPSAEQSAEKIASAFHETYEELAPEHGYRTRKASAVPWSDVPPDNRSLMIATVRRLIDLGVIR